MTIYIIMIQKTKTFHSLIILLDFSSCTLSTKLTLDDVPANFSISVCRSWLLKSSFSLKLKENYNVYFFVKSSA